MIFCRVTLHVLHISSVSQELASLLWLWFVTKTKMKDKLVLLGFVVRYLDFTLEINAKYVQFL